MIDSMTPEAIADMFRSDSEVYFMDYKVYYNLMCKKGTEKLMLQLTWKAFKEIGFCAVSSIDYLPAEYAIIAIWKIKKAK
jgi:hypothetical protein